MKNGIEQLAREGFKSTKVSGVGIWKRGGRPGQRLFHPAIVPPRKPGVFVWVTGGVPRYMGMTRDLVQVVRGSTAGRPCEDHTVIPPTGAKGHEWVAAKVVNGLLRGEHGNREIELWWLPTLDFASAVRIGRQLEPQLQPAWNRTVEKAKKKDQVFVPAVEQRKKEQPKPKEKAVSKPRVRRARGGGCSVYAFSGGLPSLGRR